LLVPGAPKQQGCGKVTGTGRPVLARAEFANTIGYSVAIVLHRAADAVGDVTTDQTATSAGYADPNLE
jgi:hypothetical protein